MHLKRIPRPVEKPEPDTDEVPEKIVRLAIGVEGGFKGDARKVEYDDCHSIVTLPNFEVFKAGEQNLQR